MDSIEFSSKALPIISDIHGNSQGLVQVLDHIIKLGIKNPPLILGDLVWHEWDDYNSSKVLDILLKTPLFGVVAGNTDQWLLNGRLEEWNPNNKIDSLVKSRIIEWRDSCSKEHLTFLKNLSSEISFNYCGCEVLAVHASPLDSNLGILPSLPKEEKIKRLAGKNNGLLLSGHLHQSFTQNIGELEHISIGPVGRHPYEYNGIIQYSILDQTSNGIVSYQFSISQESQPKTISYPIGNN